MAKNCEITWDGPLVSFTVDTSKSMGLSESGNEKIASADGRIENFTNPQTGEVLSLMLNVLKRTGAAKPVELRARA